MSARHTTSERSRAAARRLSELLSVRPAYRRRWEGHAVQHTATAVHQAAVARVLATHLWSTGRTPPERTRPRRLKDLVSRALSGRVLSPQTLTLFIEAFAMTPTDADELWVLLSGGHPEPPSGRRPAPDPPRPHRRTPVAPVEQPPPADDCAPPAPGSDPAAGLSGGYRTVALHAVQTLGPDGLPRTTRTLHVVRAVDRLAAYRFLLDAGVQQVDVVRGGTAGRPYPIGRRAAVDLAFHDPVPPGGTGSLEYVFRYRPGTVVPPRFRRGTRTRMENVELQVRFHPLRLPEQVWWTVWPGESPLPATDGEEVPLTQDGTVQRFLASVERRTVGFRWRFPA